MARVVPENLLGRHVAEQRGHALADGDRLSVGEMADERNQYEPYGKRTGADVRGIAEPDDIAQTEYGGSGIDLEDELRLIGQQRSPLGQTRRDVLGPPAERANREVVQSSDQTAAGQQLGLIALLLAGHEYLGRRGGLGKRVFPVHVLDEILAERDQQQNPEQAAEKRRQEYLVEMSLQPQNVERRQRKDRSGDDHARAGADRLDDDVLSEHAAAAGQIADADGDDRDRDSGLEHLSDPQAEISGGSREDDRHHDAEHDRIDGHLFRLGRSGHHGRVLFAGGELPVGIIRKRSGLFGFLFHISGLVLSSDRLRAPPAEHIRPASESSATSGRSARRSQR